MVVGGPGTVHLGFTRDVDPEELAVWVERQDAAAMLGALHALAVSEGDAVLVPAGLPHAIGPGLLVVELQEPTDLSVLLEWTGFDVDGERDGHLGVGFDEALTAQGFALEAEYPEMRLWRLASSHVGKGGAATKS